METRPYAEFYHKQVPVGEGSIQNLILIRKNGGDYGFVDCPKHSGTTYAQVPKEMIERFVENIQTNSVGPIQLKGSGESKLVSEIIKKAKNTSPNQSEDLAKSILSLIGLVE